MMRSLFAGVSGLRNHQIRMDVIGNNIANVNTVGFKAGRVTFREMFSQLLGTASAPQGGRGGTNPLQVGLGVSLASIDTLHEKGNLEGTGVSTDLAIDGAGFFLVSDGSHTYYTRAGAFSWDDKNNLVTPSGLKVMGWLAQNGVIPTSRTGLDLKPISLAEVQSIPARATSEVKFTRNLDSSDNGTFTLSAGSLDLVMSDGSKRKITFELSPTSDFDKWRWHLAGDGVTFSDADGYIYFNGNTVGEVTKADGTTVIPGVTVTDSSNSTVTGDITFPANGTSKSSWAIQGTNGSPPPSITATYTAATRTTSITTIGSKGETYSLLTTFTKVDNNHWAWKSQVKGSAGEDIPVTSGTGAGEILFDLNGKVDRVVNDQVKFQVTGYSPMSVDMDFYGLTQFATGYTALASEQNGYGPGELNAVSVDAKGIITGSYSNALSCPLGQVALASFSNPAGLVKRGETLFEQSANSGEAQVGDPGTGGRGTIAPMSLEMANVDLAQEFTNLIITQRGFQANSRVITTADEMLQDLVNLKR
ncbi:MAG TPA: flagellar hook protein FlgE [Firmicutes bacterium]|nr:flagellar hook protein FlgE [Bacillota bacterium]